MDQLFAAGRIYFLLLIFLRGISNEILIAQEYASRFGLHSSHTKQRNWIFFLITVRFQGHLPTLLNRIKFLYKY